MDLTHSRGLLFLLSLGGVPLACTDGTGESESEGSEATTASTGTTAMTGTTAGTATTTTDGTTTDGTTTDGTTAGTATTETSTTGDPDGVCGKYAQWYIGCNPGPSYREILGYCENDLDQYEQIGPTCLAAGEALYECLSASACDDDAACDEEDGAVLGACLAEPGPACLALAEKEGECYDYSRRDIAYSAALCQLGVNSGIQEYGAACGTALEEYYACLGALSCADFEMPDACSAESNAADAACQ